MKLALFLTSCKICEVITSLSEEEFRCMQYFSRTVHVPEAFYLGED